MLSGGVLAASLAAALWPRGGGDAAEALVPLIELPVPDREARIEAALAQAPPNVHRFALAIPVELETVGDGIWETLPDGRARWSLDLESPGARSLNLGFGRYRMPEGGRLEVLDRAGEPAFRAFTAADNEAHGELWTPLVRGDGLRLRVLLPNEGLRSGLALTLSQVSHGFRGFEKSPDKIGSGQSGTCNIDVVCDALSLPGWVGARIDQHRDAIRAVGAYTLRGVDTCSGALVNNTAGDRRPFFLTAYHCGIDATGARSVVAYWNFENSTCRQPGSFANGQPGDGPVDQFNSGAFLRAEHPASDFSLIEFDDPLQSQHRPFFAGWNRNSGDFSSAFCVHHPDVAEKRISFEDDATTTTSEGAFASPGDGTHIRVIDWDAGTTEGGSSGAPLFDAGGRVIGQLQGGGAACGNNASDWFGRLSVSWFGGGSSSSRLSDWLDPIGTGQVTLEGLDFEGALAIADAETDEGDAGITLLQTTVSLSDPVATEVTVTVRSADGTARAGADFVALDTQVVFAVGETQRTVTLRVVGDTAVEGDETLSLNLVDPVGASVLDGQAEITIRNDDYLAPVITGLPLTATGVVFGTVRMRLTADNLPRTWSLLGAPPGAVVSDSGLFEWVPDAAGVFDFDVVVSNPSGSDTAAMHVAVAANPLVEALDAPWIALAPDPAWYFQSAVTHDGIDAARSPALTHGESAAMTARVTGPDTLMFWWKVSSEPDYDGIHLLLDGAGLAFHSGEVDWSPRTVEIPAGEHTVTWLYGKDGSVDFGADAGWVDEVRLASATPLPIVTSGDRAFGLVALPFHFQVTALNGPVTHSASGLPPGLGIDAGTGVISGFTFAPGTYTGTVTVANSEGEATQRLVIRIFDTVEEGVDLDGDWSSTGPALWYTQTEETHDGVDAARSGEINDNESTSMAIGLTGPDRVSFWWKVSSQPLNDRLELYLDGSVVAAIHGDMDWARRTVDIPAGDHNLEWRYSKNATGAAGRDAGWVDEVRLASRTDYNELLDTVGLPWASDLPRIWEPGAAAEAFDGVDAARSGPAGHGENSELRVAVAGPGFVRFRWRTDSEFGDRIVFRLNDADRTAVSGQGLWQTQQFALQSGLNDLAWDFRRDGSGGNGVDAAWLDQVELLGYAGWIDQSDPADAMPDADPDGDGRSNFETYAQPLITSLVVSSDGAPIVVAAEKPAWGVTGVVYRLEGTDSLPAGVWEEEPAQVLTNDSAHFGAASFTNAPSRWFRLRATAP